jgi:hypothetical protein
LLLIERGEGVITEKIPVSYGSSAGTALIIFEDVKVPGMQHKQSNSLSQLE